MPAKRFDFRQFDDQRLIDHAIFSTRKENITYELIFRASHVREDIRKAGAAAQWSATERRAGG